MSASKTPKPKFSNFEIMAGACALAHLADKGQLPSAESSGHLPFPQLWTAVLGRLKTDQVELETVVGAARANVKKYTDDELNSDTHPMAVIVNLALMRQPDLEGDALKKEVDAIIRDATHLATGYAPDTTRYETMKEFIDRRAKIAYGLLLEQIGGRSPQSLRFDRSIGSAPFMLIPEDVPLNAQTLTQLAEKLVEHDLRATDPEFSQKTSQMVSDFMNAAADALPQRQRSEPQTVAREACRQMIRRLWENKGPDSTP